ncbi:putative transposase [Izhakiella capsodis]|uniref:Putative transposase n=1 Tax=Izhakiella capsodis TaxID=1367852 RepID=A0A1I5AU84_9GAMM|nr:putative transposase [Izhakiella capsodis]
MLEISAGVGYPLEYRRKLFDGQMIAQLRDAFGSVAAKLGGE